MTSDELRADPDFRLRMAEIFADKFFTQALICLQSEGAWADAKDEDPEIVSVRILSRMKGREQFIQELLNLSIPLEKEERTPFPTFNTGLTEEEAAEAMGHSVDKL